MIKFENFSFGFPDKDLYEDLNIEIKSGDHLALMGSNGSGKSTLIDLLMHEEKYTYEGLIRRENNIRIGYISQFVEQETSEGTVNEFLAAPFARLLAENDDFCARMAEADDLDALYAEYQKVLDEIDAVDAYNYESNIARELASAGLTYLADRPVNNLSGGEYKLLYIMRNMLLHPGLLIMDEPDVFLDFENLAALVKLINSFQGTLLAITHNRLLLTQCFDKIWYIEDKSVLEYEGNFAAFMRWKLENKVLICEHVKKFDDFLAAQDALVKKLHRWAEATCDSQYGRQIKARASYIERLKRMRGEDPFLEEHDHDFPLRFADKEACAAAASDALEAAAASDALEASDASDALEAAAASEASDASDADAVVRPLPIELSDYTLSYDGQAPILEHISFTLAPGEKAALVGANGTGKSSMLRDLYGQLSSRYPGAVGYFRQIVEADDKAKLSGGERNIAQIKSLCESPHQILILDEPTSHLDVYAQIELEKSLKEYPGTVLMVSHDLYAVTGCADRIFMIEDGKIREMSGRAYRKSIYNKYFASDIFAAEKERTETEIRVTGLLKEGKYDEARKVMNFPAEEE